MSLIKYWGDERQSDAIYAIYLKKVRYVLPQKNKDLPHYRSINFDNQHLSSNADNIDHLEWETICQRVIKAGTLEKLVKSLISADDHQMDSRQFNVFFATYRAFADTKSVLNQLIDWYLLITNDLKNEENLDKKKSNQILQNTIQSILICWLNLYPEDFYSSENKFFLLTHLIEFARNNFLNDLKHKAKKLRESYKRIAEEGGLIAQIPTIKRYSYLGTIQCDPKDNKLARERTLLFDTRRENCFQIAEQLTFWDAILFRELKSYQCQGAIWGKRHKKNSDSVYSVRATIDQFNAVSQRVMTSIVFPNSAEFRAKVIEKWITVAGELKALKNFSSLKAVLSSLQSEPVYRLKATWNLVSKSLMTQYKELSTIFDLDENGEESKARMILETEGTAKSLLLRQTGTFQQNRRTKSDVNLVESQGTVPFLGTFLTDLTMIDQAHYDTTPEGFINFEKHRREFEVLAKIKLFQSAARAYTISMDHAFCIWFYYLPSINENECFNRSLEVEPILTLATDSKRPTIKNGSLTNGFYSPSFKFHSLTKIFTHMAINDNFNGNETSLQSVIKRHQAQQRSQSGPRHNYFNKNSCNYHKRAESLEQQKKSKKLITPTDLTQNFTDSNLHTPETANKCNNQFTNLLLQKNNSNNFSNSNCSNMLNSSFSVSAHKKFLTTKDCQNKNLNDFVDKQNSNKQINDLSNLSSIHQSKTNNKHCLIYKSTSSTSSCSYDSMASSITNSESNSRSFVNNKTFENVSSHIISYTKDFHLIRVGLDNSIQNEKTENLNINYKCIKIENGDKMSRLIEKALEKHMIDINQKENYCLVQLLPDGSELKLPDNCNPFYAVAPDPTSPMLNFLLKKKNLNAQTKVEFDNSISLLNASSTKKLNRQKRSNLLRWSSGYL